MREVRESASAQITIVDLVRSGGFGEQFGAIVAVPGVAEKGYLDVRVQVTSPGGHSSIPPAHTVRY